MTNTATPAQPGETMYQYLARTLPRPFTRSKTARKNDVQAVRNHLAAYRERDLDGPSAHAIVDLAWAEAHLRRILWEQTYGRAGQPDATPTTILLEWGLIP